MKILTTKTHACLDYITAIVMICNSLLFQLSTQENYILFISGIITIAYSVLTQYELSVIHVIRTHTHFKLDLLTGSALVLLPLFFPFGGPATIVFFACGGLKIVTGLITDPQRAPSKKYTGTFHKVYDMPMYGKMEKFPRMKF